VVTFLFFSLETKKTTFFATIFKNPGWPQTPSYANVREYIIFSLLTKCLRRPDTMVSRAGLAHGP